MNSPIRIDERTLAVERLRGAKSIAAFIGVSVDTVYDLAKRDGVPIHKPLGSGTYIAIKSELTRWMRGESSVA